MAMTYTEALAMSRQMSGGLEKTAAPIPGMEGWQRAALGGLGGGLLTAGLTSLINPGMSTRAKILSALLGTGAGAAAGYRFLPGYAAEQATSKEPADKGEDGGAAQAGGAGAAAAAGASPACYPLAPRWRWWCRCCPTRRTGAACAASTDGAPPRRRRARRHRR